MPIKSVADLRKAWGPEWASASDEELLGAYSKAANIPLGRVADTLNWGPENRGMWGNRGSAAIDNYQAGLYGVAEAMGSDWAKRKRIENEVQSQVARDWAQQQGAISSYKDIGGVGDFFNYAGGLALDSAPYLGEALVGGGVGGLAARGLGTGARALSRTAGAVGASYPSAVGDVLSNQRDQTGTTNGAAAAALGVPYALANAFGIEGALARGVAMKSGIQALDDMTGLRGGLARTGASMARGALTEAPAETFQEAMNQYGRMAVDPNETFFNERSNERFAESAVGGGVLGGLFGGGMGGWRRSNDWYAQQAQPSLQPPSQPVDLLGAEVPKVGEQFSLFGSPYAAPADDAAPAARSMAELLAEKDRVRAETLDVLRQRNAAQSLFASEQGPALASAINRRLFELQAEDASLSAQLEPYQRELALRGEQGGQLGLNFKRPLSLLDNSPFDLTPDWTTDLGAAPPRAADGIDPVGLFRAVDEADPTFQSARRAPQPGSLIPLAVEPPVVNVNAYGQAAGLDLFPLIRPADSPFAYGPTGNEQQNQTLLADTTDLGTELARQRIAQGYTAPDAAAVGKGKAAPAAPAAPAQTQANDWGNRKLWTQYNLPAKSTPAGRGVFDQAVQAKANGTLDAEGFDRVVEGLRKHTNTGRSVLAAETSRVAGQKEQAGKPSAAPKAPKQPVVVVPAPAPAAGENQLLVQGAPNVSGPNLAGQPTGGSSVAGRVDAGGSVASAGPNPVATVGSADPARGVAPNDGPAATATDGSAQGVSTAVEAAVQTAAAGTPDVIVGTGDASVQVTKKKRPKAALGTAERRADILARIQAAKDKDDSTLSGPKKDQAGAVNFELLSLYAELALDHVVRVGRNFTKFAQSMVSDVGEDANPYLRELFDKASAQLRKEVKPVKLRLDSAGKPMMLESRGPDGGVAGLNVAMTGKSNAYIKADKEAGQWVLVPERSGLGKQDNPIYLGSDLDQVLEELPYAFGLLKSGRKVKQSSGAVAVEWKPKNRAVVGGAIDFELLQKATEGKPQYLKSIYLYLGLDEDGTRRTGAPLTEDAAARLGGWGKNSGQNLSKGLQALGITEEVASRFIQGTAVAPPLPGVAMPKSVRERLEDMAPDDETGAQYVDDMVDNRDLETRLIEDGAKGSGAFEDESNESFQDTGDGAALERYKGGVTSISSVGGQGGRAENKLVTSIKSVKRLTPLYKAIAENLPLDSFPTTSLLGGYQEVSRFVMNGDLTGNESSKVTQNAQENEAFLLGVLTELRQRESRARGRPGVAPDAEVAAEFAQARRTYIRTLKKSGQVVNVEAGVATAKEAERTADASFAVQRASKGEINDSEAKTSIDQADDAEAGTGEPGSEEGGEIVRDAESQSDSVSARDLEGNASGEVELTDLQRKLLGAAVGNLSTDDTATLQAHYGGPLKAEGVQSKLVDDVLAYVNKGAGAVAKSIRKAIGKLAKAIAAVAVFFNVSGLNPQTTSDAYARTVASMPAQVMVTQAEQRESKKADTAGRKLSPNAQRVANWIAGNAEANEISQIVDPAAGMMYVMKGGKIVADAPALFGKAGIGAIDARLASLSPDAMSDADKVTPAGRFSLKLEEDASYGTTLTFLSTANGGGWAIHRVYLGNAAERRAERLASKGGADNNISYGCVNVSSDFYDSTLKKFDYSGKAFAYLLPSDASQLDRFFDLGNKKQAAASNQADAGLRWATRDAALAAGASVSTQQAQKIAQKLLDKLGLAGRVRIETVGKPADVGLVPPQGVNPTGVTLSSGRIVLFSDALASDLEVLRVAFHELFHLGLSKTVGQSAYIPTMLKFLADPTVREYAARWRATAEAASRQGSMPVNNWQALAVEEALADIAEDISTGSIGSKPRSQFVRKAIVVVSELLDAAGLAKLASRLRGLTYTEAESFVVGMISRADNTNSAPTTLRAERFRSDRGPGAAFDALNKALPPSARTATSNIATIIKTAMSGIANRVVFTHDLIDRAKRVGLASAADFGRLYKERAQMTNGLSGRVDDVARLYSAVPDAERGRGPGTVNDFLKDSTRTDAWGFMPDWLPEAKRANVKVDPAMAKRFNALSPESQAYARAVFEHGYKTLELKKRTILNATVSEYDALIKAAKDAGDEDEVARLESDKSKAQTKFDSLFKTMGESPYAPLKRFGNWVVIAESTALRQARLDDDKKRIAELEQDGKHYYVDFYESQMEALNAERQLRATGNYDISAEGVAVRKKEEARDRLYGGDGMAAAFTKLRNQARMRLEGEQDASKRALLEMATDMYLSALAESSARKSEMRRRGIEGDIDMLRSFVAQGYADSHMVSALAFSGTQGDAINAMRREKETGSSADQTRKSQAFNEIVKRHADSMEYVEPNAIDGIKTAASIYYLAFSPAYYLQNLTQPWMVSLPTIAGRHDYGKTASAIWQAGSELKDAWLGSGLSQAIDLSKVPADVREAMTTLYERGILTSGLNLEFKNARASDATGAYGRTKQALGDVKDFVNDVQTKVEVMNRTATAIAAYRLELSKGASPAEALKYADDIVRQTHGDYSMMAAPRFFNSNFGKLALQFRKYQLLQLSLMARLIRESFTGTDRKAAAKALGFVVGQAGLLAGAMGLPGFTAIAWILSKMFGDPDEPDDPEYTLRKAIGNKEVADLILKGLPNLFGADLSNKIGWQNMLSVLPYTDIDMTKKSVTEVGFALTLGAAGAMAGKAVDGLSAMQDGRYIEGLTKALPTGFGNAIKGANTFLDGVRNKDGEVLLTRDEINMAEAVLMGIGLTPTDIASQQFRQRVNYQATTNFADRASKIKREFVEASREGAGRQDAIDAWKKLQDARVANGFKRQPEQELYDAVKEAKKQERNTINGVQFRTTSRQFADRLGQI